MSRTQHRYFVDFNSLSHESVFHAVAAVTATEPLSFTYQGVALAEPSRVPTDVKLINGHWVLGCHCNGPQTFYSVVSASSSANTTTEGLGTEKEWRAARNTSDNSATAPTVSPTPPASWPASSVLFTHSDDTDKYIVSVGFVVDEATTVLKGVLYGAGS